MNLYLIRHGRQSSTLCNVDVPLSEEGRRQAELLGKRMAAYPVDALYTSHLVRAKETGCIAFADRQELIDRLQIREGLAEFDFGSLTGAGNPDVRKYYADYYQRQSKLFQEKHPAARSGHSDSLDSLVGEYFVPQEEMDYPEGENGLMVLERVLPVVREWIESPCEHIAVVSHGGVIRVLMCALFGGSLSRRLMFGTSLENCSITQIHYDEALGGFFLDRFNDFAHIEAEPELMRSHFFTKP